MAVHTVLKNIKQQEINEKKEYFPNLRIDVPLKNGHIEWRGVYNYDNATGMDRKEYETKMYRLIHNRLRKAYEDEWNSK